MRLDAIPELFQIRADLDRVRLNIPADLPPRSAGAVEAHLLTAYDAISAAYSELLDVELGVMRKSLADAPDVKAMRARITDADRAVAQDGRS